MPRRARARSRASSRRGDATAARQWSLVPLPDEMVLRILHEVPPEDLVAACLAGFCCPSLVAAPASAAGSLVASTVLGVVLKHLSPVHVQPGEGKRDVLARCTAAFAAEFRLHEVTAAGDDVLLRAAAVWLARVVRWRAEQTSDDLAGPVAAAVASLFPRWCRPPTTPPDDDDGNLHAPRPVDVLAVPILLGSIDLALRLIRTGVFLDLVAGPLIQPERHAPLSRLDRPFRHWIYRAPTRAQIEPTVDEVIAPVLKLAECEDARSMFLAGAFYKVMKLDVSKAAHWFREAAAQGLAEAQFQIGVCHLVGEGVLRDPAEAVRWYRRAAHQGHAPAQFRLGFCYDNGVGVSRDLAKAAKWYGQAARLGDANAQCNLGFFYNKGVGVARKRGEGAQWYWLAAEQGHLQAQLNVAGCYQNGDGVCKDPAKAVRWYARAARRGDAIAQCRLGTFFYKGVGVARDLAEAVRLFRKAADKGYREAQLNLGLCYEKGRGVAQDRAEAVRWHRKAAAQGDSHAKRRLYILTSSDEVTSEK